MPFQCPELSPASPDAPSSGQPSILNLFPLLWETLPPPTLGRLFLLCNLVMPTFHLWQHSSHFIAITSLFFCLRAGIMTVFFTTVLDHSGHLINLWVSGWLVVICCLTCLACCVEEEDATVGKFSWCHWLPALSISPLPLWYFPRTLLGTCLPRATHRHFFRAERLVIGARRHFPLHNASWEPELDGSQQIVPATLYPSPDAQPLLCFPGVRTEQGPGWVRLNTGLSQKSRRCFIHA